MSIRSITIEGLSPEALTRFKAATKALPGNPSRVACRILEAGLDAVEEAAKPKPKKVAAKTKKTTAKAPGVVKTAPVGDAETA